MLHVSVSRSEIGANACAWQRMALCGRRARRSKRESQGRWGRVGLMMQGALVIALLLPAASPGGVSANLFSYLFGGNVALNSSLTAVNR